MHKFTEVEDRFTIDNYYNSILKKIAEKLNLTTKQIQHRIARHLKLENKKVKYYPNEKFFKLWNRYIA